MRKAHSINVFQSFSEERVPAEPPQGRQAFVHFCGEWIYLNFGVPLWFIGES